MSPDDLITGKRVRLHLLGGGVRTGDITKDVSENPSEWDWLQLEVSGPTTHSKPVKMWVDPSKIIAFEILK